MIATAPLYAGAAWWHSGEHCFLRAPGTWVQFQSWVTVWSLHILPMPAWVSSGYSGFLPQSKDVRIRLIGHAKLPLSVRGISRVNTWDYGDKAWVGFFRCRLDGPNGLLLHCRDSVSEGCWVLTTHFAAQDFKLSSFWWPSFSAVGSLHCCI